MAALENFFLTSFHSEKSEEAIVQGPGVVPPGDFVKFSNVATETSRGGSSSCGSLFAWIASHIFSCQSFFVPSCGVCPSKKWRLGYGCKLPQKYTQMSAVRVCPPLSAGFCTK